MFKNKSLLLIHIYSTGFYIYANSSKLDKINKIHDILQCTILLAIFAVYLALYLLYILENTGVTFVNSIIPFAFLSFHTKPNLYLVQFYIVACFFSSGASIVCFATVYCIYLTLFYTTELRLGQPIQKYLTSQILR